MITSQIVPAGFLIDSAINTVLQLDRRGTLTKQIDVDTEKDWNIDRNKVPVHGIPKEAADEPSRIGAVDGEVPAPPQGATQISTLKSSESLPPQLTRAFNLIAAEAVRGVVHTRTRFCTDEMVTNYDFTSSGLRRHLTHLANKGCNRIPSVKVLTSSKSPVILSRSRVGVYLHFDWLQFRTIHSDFIFIRNIVFAFDPLELLLNLGSFRNL